MPAKKNIIDKSNNIDKPAKKKRGPKSKKKLKKRGRKPNKSKINIDVKNLTSNVQKSNVLKSHILYLPLIEKDIDTVVDNNIFDNTDILSYDPSIPQDPLPYDPDNNEFVILDENKDGNNGNLEKDINKDNNKIKNINININKIKNKVNDININKIKNINNKKKKENENSIIILESDEKTCGPNNTKTNNKYIKKRLRTILYEFIEGNSRKQWPLSVKTCCLWCCHTYTRMPIAIPEKIINNKYYVYGNFCSFNCAASYIFNSNKVSIEKWETYSLLNLLYHDLIENTVSDLKIKLAPPRETLKMFGGFYSIEEFRKSTDVEDKTYNIIKPPMISIIPCIEENTNNYSLQKDKPFIPLNKELVKKAGSDLKLKRKNKNKNKNTLQEYMNLKIV